MKLDDSRSQILYHEMLFFNYMLFFGTLDILEESKSNKGDQLWTSKFYGSSENASSSVGVVLISSKGEMTFFFNINWISKKTIIL